MLSPQMGLRQCHFLMSLFQKDTAILSVVMTDGQQEFGIELGQSKMIVVTIESHLAGGGWQTNTRGFPFEMWELC